MNQLIDGIWQRDPFMPKTREGAFTRDESQFRDWVRADGSSEYRAEPGRYHLYVSLACPWAHRTLIFRALKQLQDVISVSVVDPYMGAEGWTFAECEGCVPDTANGFRMLHEVYTQAKPGYTGLVTVPVLWDRLTRTIVNNESSEIIRMFNSEFDAYGDPSRDFYPLELRDEINAINELVYDNVNNGVYRAGFARTQAAYEAAVEALFETLDVLERRLGQQRYLVGHRMTEADWRLFTTLVRFDAVYYSHFKCNLRRLVDYPNLWSYTRALYQVPGVPETVNLTHIKHHYYGSHPSINPTGIVPKGPCIDFSQPHDRERSR